MSTEVQCVRTAPSLQSSNNLPPATWEYLTKWTECLLFKVEEPDFVKQLMILHDLV